MGCISRDSPAVEHQESWGQLDRPIKGMFQRSKSQGGKGTELLLKARQEPGWLCFHNSYWTTTLWGFRGRAIAWLPLFFYMSYALVVCGIGTLIENPTSEDKLKQLSSVTSTVGICLFLLLSFRNNAAFQRWQTGSDKFNAFCSTARNAARLCTGALDWWVATGTSLGEDGYEVVLARLKWLKVAIEVGKQTLRGTKDEAAIEALLQDSDDLAALREAADPVAFCCYKDQRINPKYYGFKPVELFLGMLNSLFMEYQTCYAVYSTPLPFAYISHLRTFLVLWLLCIPWVYVIYYQWYTLILVAVIGYGIIGVEEAAVEVEQPFGHDFNDVPLDKLVAHVLVAIDASAKAVREEREAVLGTKGLSSSSGQVAISMK